MKSEYDYFSFDDKRIESIKGSAIITVILIFYSLDYENMNLSVIKARDNVCDYIHFLIPNNNLNKKNKDTPKLKLFLKSTHQKNTTSKKIIGTFIKNMFGMKNQYKKILLQLNQLLDNILKFSITEFICLINSSILFNYDCSNTKYLGVIIPQTDLIPISPFIKTPNVKEYTLVLDMDETLTHNLIV